MYELMLSLCLSMSQTQTDFSLLTKKEPEKRVIVLPPKPLGDGWMYDMTRNCWWRYEQPVYRQYYQFSPNFRWYSSGSC